MLMQEDKRQCKINCKHLKRRFLEERFSLCIQDKKIDKITDAVEGAWVAIDDMKLMLRKVLFLDLPILLFVSLALSINVD